MYPANSLTDPSLAIPFEGKGLDPDQRKVQINARDGLISTDRLTVHNTLISDKDIVANNVTVRGILSTNTIPPQAKLSDIVCTRTNIAGYGGVNLVAYTVSTGTGGQNLLFIHGFAHTFLQWKNQLVDPVLKSTHNLYAYDWRGMGESDRPDPTGVGPADTVYAEEENHADDLNAVITGLGLANVVLVSHSYGNVPATGYIRKYGLGAVVGWIKIAGEVGPVLGPGLTPDFQALVPSLLSSQLNVRIPAEAKFVDLNTTLALDKETRDHFIATNFVPPGVALALISVKAGPRGGPVVTDNTTFYASINVPVLLIHGLHDRVVLTSTSSTVKTLMTGITAQLLNPACGHCSMIELPGDITTAVLNFTNSL